MDYVPCPSFYEPKEPIWFDRYHDLKATFEDLEKRFRHTFLNIGPDNPLTKGSFVEQDLKGLLISLEDCLHLMEVLDEDGYYELPVMVVCDLGLEDWMDYFDPTSPHHAYAYDSDCIREIQDCNQ